MEAREESPPDGEMNALCAARAPLPPIDEDPEADFENIARTLVTAVAEACTIDVVTADGLKPLAVVHADAAREPELRELRRCEASRVVPGPALRLPLSVQQRQLGILTLWSEQGRALDSSELALVHGLARELAILLENRRLRELLEDSRRASDALLSMVSHELRTPLATISLGIDASAHRIETSADELPKVWLLERLQKVRRAVRRTDRLIHTFLGLSQIQTGRLVPNPEEMDLVALARSVVDALQDDLSWAGCECSLHAPGPQIGNWDPIQLEIVLNNLLTNAMKYAPGSPVEVTVGGDVEQVVVSVRDHGPGIPPEQRARLFQRFGRVRASTRTVGFGLGLWIVKHFVEANGGSVAVETEIGSGTTFTLCLRRAGG